MRHSLDLYNYYITLAMINSYYCHVNDALLIGYGADKLYICSQYFSYLGHINLIMQYEM